VGRALGIKKRLGESRAVRYNGVQGGGGRRGGGRRLTHGRMDGAGVGGKEVGEGTDWGAGGHGVGCGSE